MGPEPPMGRDIVDHLDSRTKSFGLELGCLGWDCVGELGCPRSPAQEAGAVCVDCSLSVQVTLFALEK